MPESPETVVSTDKPVINVNINSSGASYVTPWRRVFRYAQLINYAAFMILEDSSSCSHEPAVGPYPEPDEFSPRLPLV
jgi:hypothetical protein